MAARERVIRKGKPVSNRIITRSAKNYYAEAPIFKATGHFTFMLTLTLAAQLEENKTLLLSAQKMINRIVLIVALMVGFGYGFSQGFLGQTKAQILVLTKDCDQEGNYSTMMAFKCGGRKLLFYFSANDSLCDMCVTDTDPKTASDMQKQLVAAGYRKEKTKYLLPYLPSKTSDHQKFPSQVYTNGKVEYYFMPVSMNGKSAELNAVITKYVKNKPDERQKY